MSKLFDNISNGQRVEVRIEDGSNISGTVQRWVHTEVGTYLILKGDVYAEDDQLCKDFWFTHEGCIETIQLLQ